VKVTIRRHKHRPGWSVRIRVGVRFLDVLWFGA
jgi:hypothetical protein